MLGDPRGEAAQVLASHDAARVSTYLLQLLSSEAGGGMDISIQTSEVLQGVFHSKWNLQVKRLAYDLCKAVPISDEDISMHVLPGIKSDLAVDSSGSPEMAAQALRFVPHLQPHILAELVEAGEVAQMFEPAQCALQPEVRGAATAALGQVLLVPAVLHSAAKAAATAQQYALQWQNITDAMLDESAQHVVAAAVASVTALLTASLGISNSGRHSSSSGPSASPGSVLLQRIAWAAAARVAAALGPVLQMCACVPHTAQVDVARMLLLVVGEAARDPATWAGTGDPPLGSSVLSTLLPPNLVLPPLPVLVPSVLSHLSAMATNRAGDAAVRTEACRAMLKICVMVGSGDMGFSNPSPQGLADADAHRVPLPLGWARKALEGLLDLEEGGMHLVEPGSHEIVGAAVEGLSVLPLGARQHFLARLWPILTRIRDAPTRLRLFATAWAAAVQHLHSPGLVDASVERMFKDAFLLKAISGEEGGTYQSAAQLALQAHLKEQHQQEHQRQRRALEHKDELQQQQQQQQKLQALQIPQVEASNEQGVNREGDQEPGAQQQQPSPGAKQQPSPTQQAPPPQQRVRAQPPPPPGAGAGRLTASVPTRSKAPPRPPQAANAQAAANRLTSNAPPSRAPAPPQAAAKQPPNRQAAQGAGGQLAAASAAELDRSSSGSKGGSSSRSRSMASGMLSMFKRDKKADTLGLDAVHSTQQFDAPSQNAQPPAQKLQQSRASMDRASAHTSSAAADGGKSSSIVTKPVQTTASTLNTIVTMGGMLGGSKEDFGSDARQEAAELGEVPPAGVLRHEVTCTLLGVVATQPAARAARELCQEAAVAAAHDKKAVAAGLGGHGVLAQQPGMALNLEAWLLLVGHTLQATKPCLHWEPLLAPAITPNLSPASASHLPADFSTAAPDMWLQLLLLAAAAVPVLQAALLEQQEQMANAKLMRVAAGEASDEEDPFGLGIGKHGKDDNDDDNVSISSVSSSNSENSSSFASAASSSSGVSLPDQVIPNRGPRALRVGGIDGQRVQAKKEAKAKRQAQGGVEEDDWGEGAQKKKLSKLEKRKAKVMAKREAMRPRTQMEKLMLSLERCYAQLDQLLKQLLVDWTCLTRSLRPRVLWVVVRCLEMPPHPDQKWDLAIKVLHETLCRPLATLATTRASELMASAANGAMYQSGRQGWPRDKPFTFDIAAASALCEGPDYDASALVVGFTAAQHLTLKLQDALAAAGRDPDPKLVEDVSFLAGRMDDMLRACLAGSEAAAVPGLREWAKRVLRGLATIALYVPPAQREREEADKKQEAARRKRKEKRREQRRKEGGGNEGSSTSSSGSDVDGDSTVPPEDAQQQQGDGDDSSSDGRGGGGRAPAQGGDDNGNGLARSPSNKSSDSSSIDGTGGTMPVAMPPSLFMLQNMAKGKPPPPPPGAPQVAVDSEGLPTHGQVGVTNSFAEPQANDFAQGTKEYTDPGKNVASQGGVAPDDEEAKKAAKARFKEAFKSRAATIGQGNGSIAQYMLQSGAPYAPWGYPFSWGPRAAALAPSRRTRRSRNLASHVAAALTYILKGAPLLPGLLPGSLGSQQLTPHSARARIEEGPALAVSWGAARLDSPTFWSSLAMEPTHAPVLPPPSLGNPGFGHGSQSELSGPGDPLLVTGSISANAQDPSRLLLHAHLHVTNRAECDIKGALLHVLVHGPALVPKRALIWSIPRLSPQDKASHTVPVRLLGFGRVELQVRLQLLPTVIYAAAALELSGATSATMYDISGAGIVPLHLACEPLRVSMVAHMLKPPSPTSLSTTPSGFFRTWSSLPARSELSGICVWPGREGAALALSAMLRQPLTAVSLGFIPASSSYHAAFVGETALKEEVLMVVVGQLMPPLTPPPPPTEEGPVRSYAKERYDFLMDLGVSTKKEEDTGSKQKVQRALGGTAGEEVCASGRALFHISLRTSSPGVAAAVERDMAPAFVADLAPGCLEVMRRGAAKAAAARVQGQGGLKPPLHPRVAALHAGFQQGVRALPATSRSVLGAGVGPLGGGSGASCAALGQGTKAEGDKGAQVLDMHAQGAGAGAKVSHQWLAEAGLAEWQRLTAVTS